MTFLFRCHFAEHQRRKAETKILSENTVFSFTINRNFQTLLTSECPAPNAVRPPFHPASLPTPQASSRVSAGSRLSAALPQLRAAKDAAPLHRSVSQQMLV